MSLEFKIETLTASIDRLSNLLEKLGSVEPKTTTAPTAEALQAKCMELVRADRKNKQVIKDLLAAYSASLISDLDEAQRAELAVKLGAL